MTSRDPRGLDKLFANMKVISRIRQHERCATQDGATVRIEKNDSLQSIRRWWNEEDRSKNIGHIEHIMSAAADHLSVLLKEQDPKKRTVSLERLKKEMSAVCEGLRNLRATYEHDSVIVARLDVLCERVQANIAIATEVMEQNSGAQNVSNPFSKIKDQ